MSDKNSKDNENQSYISSHPSIYKKFKNWILNKDKEMMYMKNNNENKKIDVSKVSGGGLLSIKEKDGKFNVISLSGVIIRRDDSGVVNIQKTKDVISTKVLGSFESMEDAFTALKKFSTA